MTSVTDKKKASSDSIRHNMSSVKMNNGKFPYSFSVQYEKKKSINSLHKTNMFAISTSDYTVACGDRPSSSVATDEEREIFRKNEMTIKKAIRDVLSRALPRILCSCALSILRGLHLVTTIFNVLMLF